MNEEFQLKLQAYLDGELSEREAREVEASLTNNAEGRALLAELRNTSGALAVFESEIKLPESREFYWSKIQREIQRQEEPEPARRAPLLLWRRILIPAGAFAAVVIAGLLAVKPSSVPTQTPEVETFLADSGAMTYRDDAEGMTVVWLSYPAENQIAEGNSEDTIQ